MLLEDEPRGRALELRELRLPDRHRTAAHGIEVPGLLAPELRVEATLTQ